ncbi:MAG: hypothetical protein AABO57_07490 [Acidobacteriota bacterium]
MNRLKVSVTTLLIIALASCALAHDTWLIPDRFVVERDSVVTLDLTSGWPFPRSIHRSSLTGLIARSAAGRTARPHRALES